ncbi:MAG: hypothetical protein HDR10_10360 [Lachnospiraceae bacterium]|nr:hypothetical protein [Lachnospiraceae bacterium]
MTGLSKKEKAKRKLLKKRQKKLHKRVKRLTGRIEATVSFFAVFLCIVMVTIEALEQKGRERGNE